MNITNHIVSPALFTLQTDVIVYQSPAGLIGRIIKAGTELLVLKRPGSRQSVFANGIAGYVFL